MQPGDVVSKKYRLQHRVACGGMGEIWAAANLRTDREVAIKVLRRELSAEPEAVGRFAQEARATGRLRHPNLVTIEDAGLTQDRRPYLVMELLHGESLEQRLQRDGRLSQLATCVLLSQVADAVELTHRANIVHRDLSSANVFLASSPHGGDPIPKILDFGISKLRDPDGRVTTLDGALLGSPEFMSPEQAEGADDVDARTDIWSLGVLLYLCLSGQLPFYARNPNTLMLAVITRAHVPLSEIVPTVDPELAVLTEACLVKDREQRLATAGGVAGHLRRIGQRLASADEAACFTPRRRATDYLSPRPPSVLLRPETKHVASSRLAWAVACGVVGLLLGFITGFQLGARAPADVASAPDTLAGSP